MSNYPDNFRGTPYDKEREPSEAEITLANHKKAVTNMVGFAFKQWPLDSQSYERKSIIDAALTSAKVRIEELVSVSDASKKFALNEWQRFVDANLDGDSEGVLEALNSYLGVYEDAIAGAV